MATAPCNKVQTYLFFDGRCEEALEFYKKTLEAKIGMMMRFKDNPEPGPDSAHSQNGEKIMHSFFHIGNTEIMASDGYAKGQPEFKGFSLSVFAKDEADAKRMFDALGAGGKITQPLIKTFFSPSFGMLNDKFGVSWMVLVPQEMK